MEVEEWVEIQKSERRPRPIEKYDAGNPGMELYLKTSLQRKVEGGEK